MFPFWLLFSGLLRDQLACSFQSSVYLGSVELKELNYLFHKCIKDCVSENFIDKRS